MTEETEETTPGQSPEANPNPPVGDEGGPEGTGAAEKPPEKGKKSGKKQDLSAKMDKVIDILGRFDDRLTDLEGKVQESPDIRMAKLKDDVEKRNAQALQTGRAVNETDDMVEITVAPGFIDDLHLILGPKYGVSIKQGRYGTNFLATIYVPREDSSLPNEEWAVRKCDPRSKMIAASNAVQGFREWCYKVKQNVAKNMQNRPLRSLHDTDTLS